MRFIPKTAQTTNGGRPLREGRLSKGRHGLGGQTVNTASSNFARYHCGTVRENLLSGTEPLQISKTGGVPKTPCWRRRISLLTSLARKRWENWSRRLLTR